MADEGLVRAACIERSIAWEILRGDRRVALALALALADGRWHLVDGDERPLCEEVFATPHAAAVRAGDMGVGR